MHDLYDNTTQNIKHKTHRRMTRMTIQHKTQNTQMLDLYDNTTQNTKHTDA